MDLNSILNCSLISLKETVCKSEEFCIACFEEWGYFKSSVCNCGAICTKIKDSHKKTGFYYYCRTCKKKNIPTNSTWFQGNQLSFSLNMYVIHCWAEDMTIKQTVRQTGISNRIIIKYKYYIRNVCMFALSKLHGKIGGPGKIVEIDENLLFKAKYNVGRRLGSGWVFGGIQRNDKSKIFMVLVTDRTSETLIPLIKEHIEPGTTIISDKWRAYFPITSEGYKHLTVNHSVNFVDPDDKTIHTQNIENTWRWAKRKFRTTSKKPEKRIARLGEFLYRRVHKNKDITVQILKDIKYYYESPLTANNE
uniref:Putative transposase-like protein HI-13281 (Trinotate prediction) n=1 Tax=Henneguya salminicola TaxID=69463 RepID=A0A6G3MFQ8_HENSL